MMKQLIRLGLMLVAVLAMVSCTPSTPGTALKNYMSALSDKDYEKFIDGCNISEADSEKAKEIREGLIAMIQEKGSKTIEKKGGLKEVEIVSEEMAEDGNSAIVTYKHRRSFQAGESFLILPVCGEHVGNKYFQNVGTIRRIQEGKFLAETYHFGYGFRGCFVSFLRLFQFLFQLFQIARCN